MKNLLVPKKTPPQCFKIVVGCQCLGVLDGCLVVKVKITNSIIQLNSESLFPLLNVRFSKSRNYNILKL